MAAKRVALVTGSTSGIGAAIARRLAAGGFAVALHSRTSAAAGRTLASALDGATYTQADLGREDDARRLVREVLAHHGRLDVLVNNAAITRLVPHTALTEATPEIWGTLYDVNVVAPWVLISEAEPALRHAAEEGPPSAILNVSSHAGVRPKGASIPYAVSKAALNHMTRLLALALGPAVRVNAIAPGLVETPMTANWTDAQATWRERAPMRRAARPEDIAEIAAMLIGSDYVTGEVIVVDGGLNLT